MGTHRLYSLVDDDPRFAFHPIDHVCDPEVIAANERMVSVTQAFSIDLTGQVCTEIDADRKSTRLNSSHRTISYAVFCLKKKKKKKNILPTRKTDLLADEIHTKTYQVEKVNESSGAALGYIDKKIWTHRAINHI